MAKKVCKRGHTNWYVKGSHRSCRDCRNTSVKRNRFMNPMERLESRRDDLIQELALIVIEIAWLEKKEQS